MYIPSRYTNKAVSALLVMLPLLALGGCQGESTASQDKTMTTDTQPEAHVVTDAQAARRHEIIVSQQPQAAELPTTQQPNKSGNTTNPQYSVGNNQYMFDVSDHSREELVALLKRADEVSTVSGAEAGDLDIALILHGSDIGWFAKQHYQRNKELVDLAARLDALKVIDLKVCQQAMDQYGYAESEIPEFIERVPYAPAEMRRLEDSGYFRL